MKGKALRKHNLLWNTAASVLLKLFISGNERCHTTDAPSALAERYVQMKTTYNPRSLRTMKICLHHDVARSDILQSPQRH